MSTATDSRWYAVQTYSGHENKVQRLIQLKIDEGQDEGELLDVLVPTQEALEIRNGKRVSVTRRLYPGYVLVHMALNERTAHSVNNIQGVIKFVGSGKAPHPLREDEVNKILGIETQSEGKTQEEIPFHIDQVVEVTKGPFTDFSGTVQEVYPDKGKVKVEVSLFGRPTSVELDYTDLKGY
ncbi:MAG: transcription termination/antitermination protein NusG [Gemmatimonadota bacterium]|nr:transcription termination/antitermination protein NusG [Gemmatimonadota bacterium]